MLWKIFLEDMRAGYQKNLEKTARNTIVDRPLKMLRNFLFHSPNSMPTTKTMAKGRGAKKAQTSRAATGSRSATKSTSSQKMGRAGKKGGRQF